MLIEGQLNKFNVDSIYHVLAVINIFQYFIITFAKPLTFLMLLSFEIFDILLNDNGNAFVFYKQNV